MKSRIKPIAIHLPQFHPFAENDEWWGKGFTEWTNVTKAQPLFQGHYQPHLPADLGFYDLRLEEARLAQIELAKAYGIYGFCYYHYWFNGKRLMHEPLDRMLNNPKEDFPFMLCWANENWSRTWDGENNQVLIAQEYSEKDHVAHANFLCSSFFKDNRYIKINNKPVFVFYKAKLIPKLTETIKIWRNVVKAHGFEDIYLLCMDNFIDKPAEYYGFDGAIHFHPDYRYLKRSWPNIFAKLLHKLNIKKSIKYRHHYQTFNSYVDTVMNTNKQISKNVFSGITPGWDNTARKKNNGIILDCSTPEKFRLWLKHTINNSNDEFLFVNAWNEWAEGNHLEPCQKWGKKYLEVIKEEVNNKQL